MPVTRHLLVLLFATLCCATPAVANCPGDCNGDGVVLINEVVTGVAIALGTQASGSCTALDRNADGAIGIDELLTAVNALLGACPTAPPDGSATPTPSAPATGTPTVAPPASTPTDTPSPTPSSTAPNQPPRLPTPFLYRGFAGFPIALPLGAVDPEGGPLTCRADGLADGMTLDDDAVLRWTPTDRQLGPQLIPFTCSDSAEPPAVSTSMLALQVAADDDCAMPTCDPATGCTATLPSPAESCCGGSAAPRVAELSADCPLGRVLELGRNVAGFGPLQNCDRLRIRNFAQAGAELAIHVRISCISPLNRVTVTAHLITSPPRIDAVFSEAGVFLPLEPTDGFYERRNIRFPVLGGGPFFDLDNAEANLTVTVSERPPSTVSVTKSLRVRLTFQTPPDLPD